MSMNPHRTPPDDPVAATETQADRQLGSLLRQHLQRHEPNPELRAGIRAQVALKAAADDSVRAGRPAAWRGSGGGGTLLAWRSAGAGLLCGVALTLAVGGLWLRPGGMVPPSPAQLADGAALEGALVASHVRALGPGPLFQVASGDRHTVKPWFQGKLDFAPPVPDLAAAGYPLLGGRLDKLEGHTVAALVYAHRQHAVSVYIWPDEQARAPEALTRKGFHLSRWSEGGMQVWVVTDADAPEVQRFAQAWRDGAANLSAPQR